MIINQFGNIQAQRATSIWLALKLVVVLFMVCQGASIDRIFIFHTIAIVFFLYQTGRLRLVLRRVGAPQNLNQFGFNPPNNNNNNNNNNAPVPVGAEGNQEQQQQEGRESSGSQGTTAEASSSPTLTPARPTTALDVWKRGLYAFAASLWPTYGVDPRIAQAFENNNNDQAEA
ncbi:uncharacterized protein B0P05DRAFT_278773 [Gilbertella persicaria]|uniref:uncharacterized protein n=1 Tax=Gilbertella persicaria TaxID=101096 RepID=UPI00221FE77A|nr:uncharacterized protein B0P05DRAFT_278773 [Gilbertella persicaria]KAI8058656.1 hypothetical protein B0P05DRAFT_278773 [Gilbertella persicaria]